MYLKEFRNKIGATQKELANKIGATQASVAKYESGQMVPSCTVVQKYIDIFNANPNYLFLGIEPHVIDFDGRESLKIKNEIIELENKLKLLEGSK